MSTRPIGVLAVDDHPLLRAGLAAVIATQADIRLLAEAANGEEALVQFRVHRPDVTLMDLRMPAMDGLSAIQRIIAEEPHARILALTTYEGDQDIQRALAAGARGYLLKDTLRVEVLDAIRRVHSGQRVIPPAVASRLAEHVPSPELTPRELEVLQLVARGLSNADIAGAIGRAEGTVKVHLKNILSKLGVDDRTAAVTQAVIRGFIRLD